MLCQYCRKRLSFWKSLMYGRFCSTEHQKAYQSAQQEYAFGTLTGGVAKRAGKPEEPNTSADLGEQVSEVADEVAATVSDEQVSLDAQLGTPSEAELATDTTAALPEATGFAEEEERRQPLVHSEAAEPLEALAPRDLPEESDAPPETPAEPPQIPDAMARHLAMLEYDRHFYQEILDRTPVGIALVSKDMTIRYSNQCFRKLFDANDGSVSGESSFRDDMRMLLQGLAESESEQMERVVEPEQGAAKPPQRADCVLVSIHSLGR